MYIQESPSLCLLCRFVWFGALVVFVVFCCLAPFHAGEKIIAQADLYTSCMNGGSTRAKLRITRYRLGHSLQLHVLPPLGKLGMHCLSSKNAVPGPLEIMVWRMAPAPDRCTPPANHASHSNKLQFSVILLDEIVCSLC